jgi:hypothetical protein
MELRSRAHYLNIVNAIMCKNEPIEPKLSRALVGLVGWWGVFFVESARVGHRRVHGATPHPYQRRRQGGSTPLIKYPLVLVLFRMPQKYALLVAYKADCGGRGCAAQHRGPF